MQESSLLTVIIFLPLAGGILLALMRNAEERAIQGVALCVSVATFLLSLSLLEGFRDSEAGMQFVCQKPWIEVAGISYAVGVDGISLWLVLLTTFITPLTLLGSFRYITRRRREFYVTMLLLETAMIGVFAATDLFLFYVFFEASLLPMYLLIGIWGDKERIRATVKFVLYTAFGSLLMLVAILWLYMEARAGGEHTFAIASLVEAAARLREQGVLTPAKERLLFLAFALAFAIKVPLFPLHTWLPWAHVEAPAPGSVLLASILLKMGGYGFVRLALPLFPTAAFEFAPLFAALALIGIIYGALMAYAQRDMKKLVAYSSVSHLGYCLLGFFCVTLLGWQGGMYQMLAHGISTGMLFLLVGMYYERTHSRLIADYGGVAQATPKLAAIFLIAALASIGLPLTSGFVGEFTVLLGAFQVNPYWGALAATGVVLGAVYMLSLVRRVFFGPANPRGEKLADATGRELAVLVPLCVMVFVLGLFPRFFMDRMEPTLRQQLEYVRAERRKWLPRAPRRARLAEAAAEKAGEPKGTNPWAR